MRARTVAGREHHHQHDREQQDQRGAAHFHPARNHRRKSGKVALVNSAVDAAAPRWLVGASLSSSTAVAITVSTEGDRGCGRSTPSAKPKVSASIPVKAAAAVHRGAAASLAKTKAAIAAFFLS